MGEVYRARDSRLKREVAIKILPDEFSLDTDRVGRFQREAEVLASLNHPNIAGIYDVQEAHAAPGRSMIRSSSVKDRRESWAFPPVEESLRL
jgi:serine/threonine protein kinase